jgi:hypothetical protein
MIKDLIDISIKRNMCVYDSDAPSGQFTERLIHLLHTVMLRNSDDKKGRLTDIIISSEGYIDYIQLHVDMKVNFHPVKEMGVGQELEKYLKEVNGTYPCSDCEFGIALDLTNRFDEFLNGKLSEDCILMFSY